MIKILFYTNCQFMGIKPNLELNMKEIEIKHITNYQYIMHRIPLPIDALNKCDIFIYQPIDKKHGIYSTQQPDGILSHLKPTCLKISFPYIYNSGIWGLTKDAIDKDDGTDCGNRDSIKNEKKSLEEIIQMYYDNTLNFNYKSRFESSLQKLKEKEEKCDIHVSEFIQQNIRTQKIFYTQNHPTPYLFEHVSKKILDIIKNNFKNNVVTTEYEIATQNQLSNGPKWPISKSDIDYWQFSYIKHPEENADNYYIELITKYYKNIKDVNEGVADVYY